MSHLVVVSSELHFLGEMAANSTWQSTKLRAVMLTELNYLSGFQICALLSSVDWILILVIIYTADVCTAGTTNIATAYMKKRLAPQIHTRYFSRIHNIYSKEYNKRQ